MKKQYSVEEKKVAAIRGTLKVMVFITLFLYGCNLTVVFRGTQLP